MRRSVFPCCSGSLDVALEVCLALLHAQLLLSAHRPTGAVIQEYPPSVEYVDDMAQIALCVDFERAVTFVSFLHAATAKMWPFCADLTVSATQS